MKNIVEFFLSRSLLVNLLTFLLLVTGGYVAFTMNREALPTVEFDIVSISTAFPGASPQEVETLVTNPLEDSVKSVDGIKKYESGSLENLSGIIITIDPDASDKREVIDNIRTAVEQTEGLPEDAEQTRVVEFTTTTQSVVEVSIARKRENGQYLLSESRLRDEALLLENDLADIPGVSRVDRRGWRDKEIEVQLDPGLLKRFYLGAQQVGSAIQSRNINFPGGEIEEDNREIILRTIGELTGAPEVSQVYVRSNEVGRSVKVEDVAQVREKLQESDYIEKTGGNEAIGLLVRKKEQADTVTIVNEVNRIVSRYLKTAPPGVVVTYVNDRSVYVKRRLGVLYNNAGGGLLLVVASLFFFMGWRTSLMVTLGIPVSFAMMFIALQYYGITINMISMLGMIVVIGIVVDDAIIVSENFYRHLEDGKSAYKAALTGTMEVLAPVTATIATTIAAFGPLLFMKGIMGKFASNVPLVIIAALVASLLECFFILPSHLYDVNRFRKHTGEVKGESSWFARFRSKAYLPALNWGLEHKKIAIPVFFLILGVSVGLQIKFGRFLLFPGSVDSFQISLTAEKGTPRELTEKFTQAVERELLKISREEISNFTTRVGIVRGGNRDSSSKRGNNYAQLRVYLTPEVDRDRSAEEIIREVRGRTEWLLHPDSLKQRREREAKSRARREKRGSPVGSPSSDAAAGSPDIPPEFAELQGKLLALDLEKRRGGPPVGRALAIELTGDDYGPLEELAENYKKILGSIDGIVDIDDDFEEGKEEIRIRINERLAAQAGVSVLEAAGAIRTAFQGTVATSIKRAREELDVRVIFSEEFRESVESLDRVHVLNRQGNLIPLSRIVVQENTKSVTVLSHVDGKRLITVTANVDEEVLTPRAAVAKVREKATELPKIRPGYKVHYGGESEGTEESLDSLMEAFTVAVLLIFIILASLFRSLLQPLVVLAAVPFSLIGVILAFLAHGEPLSFLALMGIIGLAGVVVNDSIVLVDFANKLREAHPDMPLKEVVLKASGLRLRAILLTTITTVFGLLPTAYGLGGYDPFLIPMTLSFAWGLLFATTLTLGLVPMLYYLTEMFRDWISKFLPRRHEHP